VTTPEVPALLMSAIAMPTRSEIEDLANTLIKEAGVEEQLPVPLEKIAAYLGFETRGFTPQAENPEMAKISGLIDYASKKILVNASESLGRQRFTLAHEIGHAYLHKGEQAIIDYRADLDNPDSDKEREANQFAAALLMPREEFIEQWERLLGNKHLLALIFGASKQAIEIRARNAIDAAVS